MFDNIVEKLETIKDFFKGLYDYLSSLISLIPEPFNSILLLGLIIIIAIIVYKVLRGSV